MSYTYTLQIGTTENTVVMTEQFTKLVFKLKNWNNFGYIDNGKLIIRDAGKGVIDIIAPRGHASHITVMDSKKRVIKITDFKDNEPFAYISMKNNNIIINNVNIADPEVTIMHDMPIINPRIVFGAKSILVEIPDFFTGNILYEANVAELEAVMCQQYDDNFEDIKKAILLEEDADTVAMGGAWSRYVSNTLNKDIKDGLFGDSTLAKKLNGV